MTYCTARSSVTYQCTENPGRVVAVRCALFWLGDGVVPRFVGVFRCRAFTTLWLCACMYAYSVCGKTGAVVHGAYPGLAGFFRFLVFVGVFSPLWGWVGREVCVMRGGSRGLWLYYCVHARWWTGCHTFGPGRLLRCRGITAVFCGANRTRDRNRGDGEPAGHCVMRVPPGYMDIMMMHTGLGYNVTMACIPECGFRLRRPVLFPAHKVPV